MKPNIHKKGNRMFIGLALLFVSCLGDGGVDAGFSVDWDIEDADGAIQTCEMLRAKQVIVTVRDENEALHQYAALCDAGSLETPQWEIAVGKGTVEAFLENEDGTRLASVPSFSFEFASGRHANRLPVFRFVVPEQVSAELGPAVDLSLQLIGGGDGRAVLCESIGCGFFSFVLIDAAGNLFPLGTSPCDSIVHFNTQMTRIPAPGAATLEIAFRSPDFTRIAEQTFALYLPLGDLALGMYSLFVQPKVAWGDAGVLWQWATSDVYPDEAACGAAGIDYAVLYVHDDASNTWWTDPSRLTVPCAAYDHPGDEPLFGNDAYAGLFAANAFPAGDYSFFLGWFRRATTAASLAADTLTSFDVAVPNNAEGPNGTLVADAPYGVNRMKSDFSSVTRPRGDLGLLLSFENDLHGFGPCAASGVERMGVYLESAFGPATSLTLSDDYACEDVLTFPGLPKTVEPYDAVVYGLDAQGHMRWYTHCADLFPTNVDGDRPPVAYHCDVPQLQASLE